MLIIDQSKKVLTMKIIHILHYLYKKSTVPLIFQIGISQNIKCVDNKTDFPRPGHIYVYTYMYVHIIMQQNL